MMTNKTKILWLLLTLNLSVGCFAADKVTTETQETKTSATSSESKEQKQATSDDSGAITPAQVEASITSDEDPASGQLSPDAKEDKWLSEKITPESERSQNGLQFSLSDAVLTSLEHNIDLRSQRLDPLKSAEYIRKARAAFDPTLSMDLYRKLYGHTHSTSTSKSSGGSLAIGISEFLPTGTTLDITGDITDDFNKTYSSSRSSSQNWKGGGDLTLTQSLLRGRGLDVNLVSIRQARLDESISECALADYVEQLLVNVESTYWDCVLARQEIKIVEDSLRIAQNQMKETEERINVGKLARVDLAEARATVAQQRVNLIEARNNYDKLRLRLIQITNPVWPDKWNKQIKLDQMPTAPALNLDPVEQHISLALSKRPDIKEARIRIKRGELEIVRTKNGLLPKLDFYIGVDGSGGNLRNSSYNVYGTDTLNVKGGLRLNYDIGNRDRSATHELSQYSLEQAKLAVDNLGQVIQVEVRSAYLDVLRFSKQITATRLLRKQYEMSLMSEKEKFKVGRNTNLDVAQAQRNYLSSRLDEARAVINTIKSLTRLYRVDGSLLQRRGVMVK